MFSHVGRRGSRLKLYEKIEEGLSMLFFVGILLLMISGVILRYIFSFTFPWNIELARYAFVWLTFVGAAYVRHQRAHIKIEIAYAFFEKRMPPSARRVIWLVKEVPVLLFLVLLVALSVVLAWRSRVFRSQAMQISQFFLYIAPAVGGVMFLLREVSEAVRQWREGFQEPTSNLYQDRVE